MVLIETDIIIALASRTDRHHKDVKKLLNNLASVKLSPYSLIELDLLIMSHSLIVKTPEFYQVLNDTLKYYDISVLTSSPSHFTRAWYLRDKYDLTFFDSLHAATALEEREILVSYDRTYAKIKELEYKHPSLFL